MIIVTGLPGTGKTTFAAALASELDLIHLNTDMIRDDMGKRGQYDEHTKAMIYEALLSRAEKAIKDDKSLIIDGTFHKRKRRQLFVDLATRYVRPITWIELKADDSVIRQRVSKKRTYSEADFSVYLKIKEAYEPIDEDHLVLRSDDLSIPEMVAETRAFLIT